MIMTSAQSLGRPTLAAGIAATVPVPKRVLVCPWGSIRSQAGDFVFDAESARAVVRAMNSRQGAPIVVDYNHASLGGCPCGAGTPPIAGHISRLEAENGVGLFAHVDWTPQAEREISHQGFRYFSPVLLARKADGKAFELHSVALTNHPAIAGMRPIVNSAARTWSAEYEMVAAAPVDLAARPASAGAYPIINSLPRQVLSEREAVIGQAAAEFDAHKGAGERLMCVNRATWVNGSLHEAGLARLTNAERERVDRSEPGRAARIQVLKDEWHGSRELRRLSSGVEAWVNGSLLADGLAGLSAEERAAL